MSLMLLMLGISLHSSSWSVLIALRPTWWAKKLKSFRATRTALISVSVALGQTPADPASPLHHLECLFSCQLTPVPVYTAWRQTQQGVRNLRTVFMQWHPGRESNVWVVQRPLYQLWQHSTVETDAIMWRCPLTVISTRCVTADWWYVDKADHKQVRYTAHFAFWYVLCTIHQN